MNKAHHQGENFNVNLMNHNHNSDEPNVNSANLFIKKLSADNTSTDLYNLFKHSGEFHSIKIKSGVDGKCVGYGYVMFNISEDADKAKENYLE
jgi:RNA recognition motif-containing protein